MSDFGKQLREKQKLRRIYGLLERQSADLCGGLAQQGRDRPSACCSCWSRVWIPCRTAWGSVRAAPEARQIVRHNAILVNGKRVNMPSYQVRPGDTVEVVAKARSNFASKGAVAAAETRGFPEWIEVHARNEGQVQSAPGAFGSAFDDHESLVVELYSK